MGHGAGFSATAPAGAAMEEAAELPSTGRVSRRPRPHPSAWFCRSLLLHRDEETKYTRTDTRRRHRRTLVRNRWGSQTPAAGVNVWFRHKYVQWYEQVGRV